MDTKGGRESTGREGVRRGGLFHSVPVPKLVLLFGA